MKSPPVLALLKGRPMLDSTEEKVGVDLVTNPFVQPNLEAESKLSEEIATLWSAHRESKVVARRTKEELKALRRTLGERLWEMKSLLARSGRGGGWADYLRSQHLPRATAERYIKEHKSSLVSVEANRTNESISEPSEADIPEFASRLLPKLRKVLTTQEALFEFVCCLLVDLPGVHGDVTDSAVEIYRPTQKSAAK